jgi:RNA polymerase sigma-70 factor (ECF subfamily)
MNSPSDRDLVERTRRGEVETFGELVRRYQQSVFNVCYRMLGERTAAEDLAQESFIRAYEKLGTFDVERPFGPWIRKLAVNLCLNRLQKKSVVSYPLDDERDGSGWVDPEKQLEKAERSTAVRQAISALPAHYRAVIELRHFQELSYAEIANQLGIKLSDVKSHLFRARKSLSKKLGIDD